MTMQYEPQRMCCFCRNRRPQASLIRIVQGNDGYFVCSSVHTSGRSAYVCKDEKCIRGMIRKRALDRSFCTRLGEAVYEKLSKELETIG